MRSSPSDDQCGLGCSTLTTRPAATLARTHPSCAVVTDRLLVVSEAVRTEGCVHDEKRRNVTVQEGKAGAHLLPSTFTPLFFFLSCPALLSLSLCVLAVVGTLPTPLSLSSHQFTFLDLALPPTSQPLTSRRNHSSQVPQFISCHRNISLLFLSSTPTFSFFFFYKFVKPVTGEYCG